MTSEPAHVLIAGLCLVALVLAGGATQALVPGDPNVEFVIGTGGQLVECPKNQVVFACASFNGSQRETIDLFQSFRGLFIIEGVSITFAGPSSESDGSQGGSETDGTTAGTQTASESEAGPSGSPTRTDTPSESERSTSAGETATPGSPTEAAPPPSGAGGPSLEWLLWPALAVLAVVAGAGLAFGLRRGDFGAPGQLRRLPGMALDTVLSAVVRVAAAAAQSLQAFWAAVTRTITGLVATGSLPGDDPLARRLTSAVDALLGGLGSFVGQLLGRARSSGGGAPAGSPAPAGEPSAIEPTAGGEVDIRTAWRWLANRTGGRDAGPRTPDDIARAAIEGGYPRDAVRALLRAFHDVTYGEYPPTEDRRRAARDAVERLRQAERASEGGGR